MRTIEQLAAFLAIPVQTTVKAIVVEAEDGAPVLMMVRGDHELNEIKAQNLEGVRSPLTFAAPSAIQAAFGAEPGSLGPVGFAGRVVMDRSVAAMADFVIGANETDFHLTGANIGRDFVEPETADLRNVVEGDPSPDGGGKLKICRGIEVGHIFQLRTKYSEALGCRFLDENGREQVMEMGCYGIGVSRILGAAIEQNWDERGIVWPDAIAPFEAVICPVGWAKSEAVRERARGIYESLMAVGVDVILDDRGERPGVMFADWELIGVPHRITIGDRGLADGIVEYNARAGGGAERIPVDEVVEGVQQRVRS